MPIISEQPLDNYQEECPKIEQNQTTSIIPGDVDEFHNLDDECQFTANKISKQLKDSPKEGQRRMSDINSPVRNRIFI